MTKNTFKSMARTSARAMVFTFLFAVPYPCRAFITTKLWKWFVVPTFGAPPLLFSTALAFVLLSALVLVNVHKNQGEHFRPQVDKATAIEELFFITSETLGRSGLILLISYILHLLGPK